MAHRIAGLVGIVGIVVVAVGLGTVGAAALVSTALAVLAPGTVLVLLGVVAIYPAATLEQVLPPARARSDRPDQ